MDLDEESKEAVVDIHAGSYQCAVCIFSGMRHTIVETCLDLCISDPASMTADHYSTKESKEACKSCVSNYTYFL